QCTIKIEPRTDVRPVVALQLVDNVFRKKPNTEFYMVTPRARIPFGGKIVDDHGLNRVEWTFSVAVVEREATLAKAQAAVTAYQFTPGGFGPQVMRAAYVSWLMQRLAPPKGKEKSTEAEEVPLRSIKDEVQLRTAVAGGAKVVG